MMKQRRKGNEIMKKGTKKKGKGKKREGKKETNIERL